jgi:hypothetical protein
MKKTYSEMNKKKQFVKYENSEDMVILRKIFNTKSQQMTSNFNKWFENVIKHEVPKLSVIIQLVHSIRKNEKFDIRVLERKITELVEEVEPSTKATAWRATPAERDELAQIADPDEKETRRKEMIEDWQEARHLELAQVKTRNGAMRTTRDVLIKEKLAYAKDVDTVINRVMELMSLESRREIEEYVTERHNDDPADQVYDYLTALDRGDYMWIFKAARETHLLFGSGGDEYQLRAIYRKRREELGRMHHASGPFANWLKRFGDAVNDLRALGDEIEDREVISIGMDCLNPIIFRYQLDKWRAGELRDDIGGDLSTWKSWIMKVYAQVSYSEPSLISKVYATPKQVSVKDEITFVTTAGVEKAHPKKENRECYNCGKIGHIAKDCYSKSTIKNKEGGGTQSTIADKKSASTSTSISTSTTEKDPKKSVSVPKKAGVKSHTETGNECQSYLAIENIFLKDEESEKSVDLTIIEHYVGYSTVPNDMVDVMFDTGTECHIAGSNHLDCITDIKYERIKLKGMGETFSERYGQCAFGMVRIVEKPFKFLVLNYTDLCDQYALIDSGDKHSILAESRPDAKQPGLQWRFVKNVERFGDKLFHCVTSKVNVRDGVTEDFTLTVGTRESFYSPPVPVRDAGNPAAQGDLIAVQEAHARLGHASGNFLFSHLKAVGAETAGYSGDQLARWEATVEKFCTGCLQGKMIEQFRIKSSKPLTASKPGDVGVADLMFIETRIGKPKQPFYVHVDVFSHCILSAPMNGKTLDDLAYTVRVIRGSIEAEGLQLKKLVYDRESAIVALEPELTATRLNLDFKAAGQKVGLVEVTIRFIREGARATKAGVHAKYNYMPPVQWNKDLCLDVCFTRNRLPRPGQDRSPYELFTGKLIDWMRDFRAEWGEVVVVKKPRGISSDLTVTGEMAVVVRRGMSAGSGVLKVYLVTSKRFAYRIKFKRVIAPEWVITALQSIGDGEIGFETDAVNPDGEELLQASAMPELVPVEVGQDDFAAVDEAELDEALELLGAREEQELGGALLADERAEAEEHIDPADIVAARTRNADGGRQLELAAEEYADRVVRGYQRAEPEDTGRVVFDKDFKRTERNEMRAREILRSAYMERYAEEAPAVPDVEPVVLVNMYFQKALKQRPTEAKAALFKEVSSCLDKDLFEGVLEEDLLPGERALILSNMKNFVEKYLPNGEFEKYKTRVLVRGDLQFEVGETQGPVCRVESLNILMCIAVFENYEVFKVDVSNAYMNTPMPESVKHKWVVLDQDVVAILLELDSAYWSRFLRSDGKILVRMKKLMYGYKEAAHYWNKTLMGVFFTAGYKQCAKDHCVLLRREGELTAIVCTVVDDCTFIVSRTAGDSWREAQVQLLRDAFGGITVSLGAVQQIIGMTFELDYRAKRVTVSMRNFAAKLAEVYELKKSAVTPALDDFFDVGEGKDQLGNQREYMAMGSSALYAAKRTYPHVLAPCVFISSRYQNATVEDKEKALRVLTYIHKTGGNNKLIFAPSSMQLVASADASYGEHIDGKSHTGGCVGFESVSGCWTIFVSQKQPVIAKSSCEAELIAVNTVGDHVEWAIQLMEELGYPQQAVPIEQDNTCALELMKQGTGSFKRSKHIKVRFFWLKQLVEEGRVKLVKKASENLVADILTKPTTGAKFRKLSSMLLGHDL